MFTNLILKKDRFLRSVEKMRAFKYKYIIIQQTYAEFLDVKNWAHVSKSYPRRYQAIAAIESWLISLSQSEGIHFIWAGQKYAPRIAKKILCKSYEYERKRLMREDKDDKAI